MNAQSQHQAETLEIYDYIKEFLKFNNFSNSLECFEAEIKTKQASNKGTNKQPNLLLKKDDQPRLYSFLKSDGSKTKREINLEKEFKAFNKKYQQILQAGRQIFSVSINLLQMLHSMKEVLFYRKNHSFFEKTHKFLQFFYRKTHKWIENIHKFLILS